MESQLRTFPSTPKSSPFSDRAIFLGTHSLLSPPVRFESGPDSAAFALPRIWFEKLAFLTTLQPRWRSFDGWFLPRCCRNPVSAAPCAVTHGGSKFFPLSSFSAVLAFTPRFALSKGNSMNGDHTFRPSIHRSSTRKHHWWPFSPALLILAGPLGFRATCYYYRKAYYRAFFLDPPACAVGEPTSSQLSRGKPLFLSSSRTSIAIFSISRFCSSFFLVRRHPLIFLRWPFRHWHRHARADNQCHASFALHFFLPLPSSSGGRQTRLFFLRDLRALALCSLEFFLAS